MSEYEDKSLIMDLKILVLGKSGTGKTSFVNKWIKNEFHDLYKATIVSEYSAKIYIHENKKYKINLWDIAGQDHYATVTKTFSKGAHGCITMCDCLDSSSLENTVNWKTSLDESELFGDGKKLPNILVQNKADLISENELQDMTKLEEFSKKNEFDACFKASAKTGLNINESMDALIDIIIKRLKTISDKDVNLNRKSVSIDPEKHSNQDKYRSKQTGCC
jgi:small GTP-binding protein